jgi:dihydroorotate dehydrogenase electron transfer subunit
MSADVLAAAGAELTIVIDGDGTSDVANVERIACELIDAGGVDAFATCGSTRLMLLLQRLGRERGVRGEVALEQQMACGLGMCFCCVRAFQSPSDVEYRRVCWDGPVFDLAEALPW